MFFVGSDIDGAELDAVKAGASLVGGNATGNVCIVTGIKGGTACD